MDEMDTGLTMDLSKTQIDRLGERLKIGSFAEADLILLDEYRQSFGEAYETVFRGVSQELRRQGLGEPTGRTAKSTGSIIDKLRRESIRLTQIQDIAGCRVVVPGILAQEHIVGLLDSNYPEVVVIDRRLNPSHGYRAVHVVVKVDGKPVEIQIRSKLQHLWAELSEKFSDILDPSIKYGGGDELVQVFFMLLSLLVVVIEKDEKQLSTIQKQAKDPQVWLRYPEFRPENIDPELERAWLDIERHKERAANVMREIIGIVSELANHTGSAGATVALGRGLGMLSDKFKEWDKELSEEERGKRQEQ